VTEAVKSVTWTGGKIEPGQFEQFTVSVGLPDASSLEFKALQTYSDGTVTRWIEETPPGGTEPEHPAPVLTLTSAADTTTATTAANTSGGTADKKPATKSSVDSAKSVSVVAIVVGALGLIVALGAFVAGRRPRQA
jgi:hypothetical protein